MKTMAPKFFVGIAVVLLAFAVGGLSFYQLSHIFPGHITYLALNSAFFVASLTKLRSWGGLFAVLYVLFHALLSCATAASVFYLSSGNSEPRHQKMRFAFGLLLSVPITWFMSYYGISWVFFAWIAWGLLAVIVYWKWPLATRVLHIIIPMFVVLLGGIYLVILFLGPKVPPNGMP